MEFLSGFSGGALGFIHGNVRGAIKGYKFGRKLYQNKHMAPIPNKRKRTVAHIASNKRRINMPSGRKRSTTRPKVTYGSSISRVDRSGGRGTTRAAISTVNRKTKGVAFKKPLKVTVGRQFKAKVKKALEPGKNVGFKQEIYYTNHIHTLDNVQHVDYLFNAGQNAGLFSPIRVLDAASVLFNEKADSSNKNITTNNFKENSKIEVIKQWANIKMKNNTRRTLNCKLFEFAPKSFIISSDPFTQWSEGLVRDTLDIDDVKGINLNSVTYTHLGLSPLFQKQIQANWKVSEVTTDLEPGQEYSFNVDGPSQVYDFSKYHDSQSVTTELYKPTRFIILVMTLDLVNDTASSAFIGRYGDFTSSNNGLIVETTLNYKIACPENTGFRNESGQPADFRQTLNMVKSPYHYSGYYPIGAGAGRVRVDEQQPTTVQIQ
jgi:hypothetical protein